MCLGRPVQKDKGKKSEPFVLKPRPLAALGVQQGKQAYYFIKTFNKSM